MLRFHYLLQELLLVYSIYTSQLAVSSDEVTVEVRLGVQLLWIMKQRHWVGVSKGPTAAFFNV
jgi:hypothetical protein